MSGGSRLRRIVGAPCLIASVALVVGACSSSSNKNASTNAKTTGNAATASITLADLESLTGAGASVGVPQANAVKLAVQQINAAGGIKVGKTTYTFKLDTADDKSDPTAGVTAVQKFVSDGRKYMIGSLSSAVTGAYIPAVGDSPNFVSVVVGAALEGITDHQAIYRPRVTLSQYTSGLTDYLAGLGTVKKVALLTDQQHSGFVQQTEPLKQALSAKGIDVVGTASYTFGATDFSAQLTSLLRGHPDALNFRGYPADLARAVKQARQQGFNGPIYTTSGTTKKEVTDAQSAAQMQGVVDVYAPLPSDLIEGNKNADVAKSFEASYEKAFGQSSGGTSMSAYDGVYILAHAFEKAGTVDDVGTVRKALDGLTTKDVPELVEPVKAQPGDLIFAKHQAFFGLAVREWKTDDFHAVSFSGV